MQKFIFAPDHAEWHTHKQAHEHTVGRIPLDEGSARRKDLYLTTRNIHNRQISMPQAGVEPAIPASERPQTHVLDLAATGIGAIFIIQISLFYGKRRFV